MAKKVTTRDLIMKIIEDTNKVLSPSEISDLIKRKKRTVLTVLRQMSEEKEISEYSDFLDGRCKFYGTNDGYYSEYYRINKFETKTLPNGVIVPK